MLDRLRRWAGALKREVLALWLAARDPRTPWAARLVAGATAAYALSPIDLIPDVIPVLGLLDDLLIVPAGVWLALRLIPAELMSELHAEAARMAGKPHSRLAAGTIIVCWLALAVLAAMLLGFL